MTSMGPPDRREKDAADEPREPERRDAAVDRDEDVPDFAAEFDHPSGRLDEVSRWEP